MAEIKKCFYVPLSMAMKHRKVDLTREKVYVQGRQFVGGASVTGIERGPLEDEANAVIKYAGLGQKLRVPLSQLLILEPTEENKTEENIMLFKGYKVAVVTPTESLSFSKSTTFESIRASCSYNRCTDDVAFYCDLKIGDFVAYIVNDEVRTGRVANIIEDTTVDGIHIRGEVLDVIDTTAYANRCQKAVEAENLKKQMDAEVERMKEQAAYDSFAEKNPFLSEMLARYKSIMDGDTKAENKNDAE